MTDRSHLTLRLLQNAPLILFLAVFVIFGALAPRFFSIQSVENILKQASYIGIIAVGMTFVLLTAGIDLSVGSVMYLSAVVAGKLMLETNAPIWLGILAAIGVGLLCGLVNALLITRLRIIPFVATLATLAIGRGLGLTISQSEGINYPDAITAMGSTRVFGLLPLPIVIFGLVVLVAQIVLTQTAFGRQVYAIGNDLEAAKKAGINTRRILTCVYCISGICAAIGGIVLVAQFGIVTAGFGDKDEFDAIAAAVLGGTSLFGGRGSVFPGAVLGTVLTQMVVAGLIYTRVDIYLQPLVFGAIIFLAVLIDSVRNTQIVALERRTIRTEKNA
jgi:ribose/xylose/arabinose/galactoside ABC-type transport system permease subunit